MYVMPFVVCLKNVSLLSCSAKYKYVNETMTKYIERQEHDAALIIPWYGVFLEKLIVNTHQIKEFSVFMEPESLLPS
jgi:hypothetical protein